MVHTVVETLVPLPPHTTFTSGEKLVQATEHFLLRAYFLTATSFEDPASKMQAAPVVIVNQPVSGPPVQTSNWQTGLCDCFTDCEICLCGLFCTSCLASQIAGDMNECCLCGSSVAMRTLYRTRYGIPGSICDDYLVTYFCLQCSLCQIKRDIRRRMAMRTF